MSPTAARNVAATITFTPGTVISRLTCGEVKASRGDLLLDLGDLLVEELDLAQTAVDGLALLDRQLDLAQPFAAGEAEQVADRRLRDQPPHQHGVALVLRARAGPDQLAAPREPPPQRPRLLVGHPQPVQRPGGQQLRQRASVEPIGLRARLPDPRVAGMHDQHLADVRLEDPRDLPRVAGHLQHHPIARAEALRKQLQRRRRRLDPARRTDLARLDDRDLAEVAVDVQPDAPHPLSLPRRRSEGNRWANDTDGFVLTAHPGRSQGRPPKSRARSPSRKKRPAQPAFPRKPLSRSAEPTATHGQELLRATVSCPEEERFEQQDPKVCRFKSAR